MLAFYNVNQGILPFERTENWPEKFLALFVQLFRQQESHSKEDFRTSALFVFK